MVNKKKLYESIMKDVSKVVKRHLNENKGSSDVFEDHCLLTRNSMSTNFKTVYLVFNSFSDYEWTADKDDATLFRDDVAEDVQERLNNIVRNERPYPGYIRIEKLPLTIEDREPKYEIGEYVYELSTNDRLRNLYCYGAYLSPVKKISVDYVYPTFSKYPTKKEYHYETEIHHYMYPIAEDDWSICNKEELIERGAKFYKEDGTEYFKLNNMTFKVIKY